MENVDFVFGTFTEVGVSLDPGTVSNPPAGIPEVYTIAHLVQGSYTQYLLDTKYVTDTGLRVIPKAASNESADIKNAVVRIHRGLTEKWVYWTVERQNELPDIPQLSTGDPNEIPISQEIVFANKLQLINGCKVYRSSGVNYYRLVKPKDSNSKYPIGTTPAEVSPSAANFYGPDRFKANIIDAAYASPGGTLPVAIRVGT